MAGRGCTVTVRILRRVLLEGEARHASVHHSGGGGGAGNPSGGGSVGDGAGELETSDMTLPVALHSPLSVLRSMLQSISGIDVAEQVLVLCDLTDPDRNRDVHLADHWNDSTLAQCGITDGSYLTLHALGVAPDSGNTGSNFHDLLRSRKETKASAATAAAADARPVLQLVTEITPADANHSYNGVMFDVHTKSPFEVDLYSVHVGGMLGRVRVFGRHGSWKASPEEREHGGGRNQERWWAVGSENVAKEGWILLADAICAPSWDKAFEIPFKIPIHILPGGTCAIYVHSSLPDDLGLQYQSYSKTSIVAEDDHLVVTPGLGHTGAVPFDEDHGWYRAYRGLAGKLSYRCSRKGWTVWTHRQFPPHLRDAVRTLLLCRHHSERRLTDRAAERRSPVSSRNGGDEGASSIPVEQWRSLGAEASTQLELGSLHVHLLYYIMEFMDWDWALDPLRMDEDGEVPSGHPPPGGVADHLRRSLRRLVAQGMPWEMVGQVLGTDSFQQILDMLGIPNGVDIESSDDLGDDDMDDEDYVDEEDEESGDNTGEDDDDDDDGDDDSSQGDAEEEDEEFHDASDYAALGADVEDGEASEGGDGGSGLNSANSSVGGSGASFDDADGY